MFGSGGKIKLPPEVLVKAEEISKLLGCSVDEFVSRAVEREADRELAKRAPKRQASAAEVEEIANKMQGLGYLE